jgi:hypothetical protein
MATIAENTSAALGEAVLGRMTLGATVYRGIGEITIVNQRQARITITSRPEAEIVIVNQHQTRITIESE